MKSTVGFHIGKQRVKWINLHNERVAKSKSGKKINRNNQSINPKYTRCNINLNRVGTGGNLNAWYDDFMMKYIDGNRLKSKYEKYLSEHRKSYAKKFRSKKSYLKHLNGKNSRCCIISVGNHDTYKTLLRKCRNKGLDGYDSRKYLAGKFKNYLVGFGKRHNDLILDHMSVHTDEAFLHAHVRMVARPQRTRKGKWSYSFDKALTADMGTRTNQQAMRSFHKEEDSQLAKNFGIDLVRTGADKRTQQQHAQAVSLEVRASSASARVKQASANASVAAARASNYAYYTSKYFDRCASASASLDSRQSSENLSLTNTVSSLNNSFQQASASVASSIASVQSSMSLATSSYDAKNIDTLAKLNEYVGVPRDKVYFMANKQYYGKYQHQRRNTSGMAAIVLMTGICFQSATNQKSINKTSSFIRQQAERYRPSNFSFGSGSSSESGAGADGPQL